MKKQIRNQVAAFFLLLPAATVLLAVPGVSLAQQATPELRSMQVGADDGLSAGSQLDFTIEGTPRGQASVSVRGIPRTIVLKETSRGVYEGSYTIRRKDRVAENSPIRATLRLRNRTTAANYSFPAGIANASVPTAPPAPVAAAGLKIDRFTVAPVDKIEPGAELRFTLNGAPGGTAEFDIPGVINNVAMREVRPGVYEGAYTIRRLDNLAPSRPVVATLRIGDRAVTSTLTQPLMADAKPPVIRNLSPRDGESITRSANTSVSGTFDDAGGVGVDPKSVRIMLAGRDVTAAAQITPQFFTYRADLPAGRYAVDVTAKDMVGNAVRQTWTFDVAAAVSAAPATVLLQVTSHANNASVEGSPVVVRGRTAPGAVVDVKVSAVGTLAGLFGMNQDLLTQRIQADGNGNFSFSFSPQFPLPGTRYEVSMTAGKDGMVATETKLVLFQKQG
ncbi:MAG: Ig-like domain-containing protein [Polaromonas sp.]|uniref:Ig-like domain-containing protein n=2 Tax=Polaromonas sp. TaxID=1869339 RepID=UPI0027334294|nr:Ig-like domain-containing protein [Polaromonas sp.]MDP3247782.1 Ig-like domain-containing protein [Polaromonas sp.]MDP3753978.1 Ig-like domain-containing protein [Polaromonas sp.]